MPLWQYIKDWWVPPPKTTPLTVIKADGVRVIAKGGNYDGRKRSSSSTALTRDIADNLPDVVTIAVLNSALSTPPQTACTPDEDSDLISSFASGVGDVCSGIGDVVSSVFD